MELIFKLCVIFFVTQRYAEAQRELVEILYCCANDKTARKCESAKARKKIQKLFCAFVLCIIQYSIIEVNLHVIVEMTLYNYTVLQLI